MSSKPMYFKPKNDQALLSNRENHSYVSEILTLEEAGIMLKWALEASYVTNILTIDQTMEGAILPKNPPTDSEWAKYLNLTDKKFIEIKETLIEKGIIADLPDILPNGKTMYGLNPNVMWNGDDDSTPPQLVAMLYVDANEKLNPPFRIC